MSDPRRRFCSSVCKARWHRARVWAPCMVTCLVCGVEVEARRRTRQVCRDSRCSRRRRALKRRDPSGLLLAVLARSHVVQAMPEEKRDRHIGWWAVCDSCRCVLAATDGIAWDRLQDHTCPRCDRPWW